MKAIGMNDELTCDIYNGTVVSDIVHEPGVIFSLIKLEKLNFDDEVLKEAHITKTIRDVRYRLS